MALPAAGSRARLVLVLAALLLAAGLLPFAFRPPRYTLVNTGLRVDYRWTVAAAAAGAALALAAATALAARRAARIALVLATLALATLGVSRLVYRVEAGPETLRTRALLGGTVLPWREVTRIDRGPETVVVWGKGDDQVRIDTAGFREDQRSALDRSIARRVGESATSPAR